MNDRGLLIAGPTLGPLDGASDAGENPLGRGEGLVEHLVLGGVDQGVRPVGHREQAEHAFARPDVLGDAVVLEDETEQTVMDDCRNPRPSDGPPPQQ
jgi:hypothetical protein